MSGPSTARVDLPFHDGTLTVYVRTVTPIPAHLWAALRDIVGIAEQRCDALTAETEGTA